MYDGSNEWYLEDG